MKFNRTTFGFVCLSFAAIVSFSTSNAQKNKKTNVKDILKMDFEDVKGEDVTEVNNIDIVEKGVSSPTELKADIFHVNGSSDVGIPANIYGKEDPTTENGGKVYAGIVAYKPGKAAGERSYITIELNQMTLKKGLTYCVEYSLSLSESSKFACNNLAMYFSKDKLGDGAAGAIYLANDPNKKAAEYVVKGQLNQIHNGFLGWEKVCNTYTAKGDEKFITIGNFDKNETTKFQAVKKPKDSEVDAIAHAYYYIDNVIVRLVDSVSECACYNARPPKIEDNFSTLIYDKEPEITDKMPVDKKIAAQTIYFRQGKASLTENAKEHMNFVIEEMNANPSMKIEISGNCDEMEVKASEENEDYLDIDRKRVDLVVRYFVAQGIAEERLSAKKYNGTTVTSSEIVEDDEPDLMQAKNRRVEFRVIK